jgi:DUF4097 and DUF4098 domain-containing protein YvlB
MTFPVRSSTLALVMAFSALSMPAGAQSTERSIERMAESIAAAAERMAARVERHATVLADRLSREFERKQRHDPSWRRDDRHDDRDDNRQEQLRSRIDTTFAFSADGLLDLSNLSGTIVVTGWDRREAQVKATSERGVLDLSLSSSRITLEEEVRGSRWGRSRRDETKYEVSVPRGVRVRARSTSGDVMVTGTNGEVEASTTSGDVEVSGAARRVELSSVSGDVTARDLKGTVDASSVSGSVELSGVEGTVRVGTTSGDIGLASMTARDVEASTTSGEIVFGGSVAEDGRYEFHSHSGNIELSIPGTASARFSVETYSGEIDSDFPITLQPGDRSSRRNRRFDFNVGGGSARIVAETFSGNLEIRKR